MRDGVVVVLIAALVPAIAASQETGKYQCSYGELQRRVEIAHEPGVEVPCSVHYYKDTEAAGEQQVLWSADNDPNYCDLKAKELVAKLEGWGWDCGRDSETATDEDVLDEDEVADFIDDVLDENKTMEPVEEQLGDQDAP